jgi:hypothetical protein
MLRRATMFSFSALCVALLSAAPRTVSAQVGEQALQAQLELGGAALETGLGGYGATSLTLELHPAYLVTARYQLEVDQDQQIQHRPLLEVRYQLNVLKVIPWVSFAAGAVVSSEPAVASLRPSLGGALGADWRLDPQRYLSFSGRYAYPSVWTLGVAFGWRFILNDPFDS